MNQQYLQLLCHKVVASYDEGGDHLRSSIETLRIALTGKSRFEYANEIDNTPLSFGKYKGHTPEEVAVVDPSYVVWMFDNIKPAKCSKELRDGCEWERQQEAEQSEFDSRGRIFYAEDF